MNTSNAPLGQVDSSARPQKSGLRYLTAVLRILPGLFLLLMGLNGLLNFLPQPKVEMSQGAMDFSMALMKSGYMMQLIAVTQVIVGLFFVINRFVPLALALFAPFMVNSILFHLFLEHKGLPMSAVFLAIELYLAWAYRDAFRPMLRAKVDPR
jgi:uncharacterized membrane protein YphA (DoxX/SURF4 family)